MRNIDHSPYISNALRKVCDSLRGEIDLTSFYLEYIVVILFWRYLSDFSARSEFEYSQNELSDLDTRKRFIVQDANTFWAVYECRHNDDIGTMINNALKNIENDNKELTGVFQGFGFETKKLGDLAQRNNFLRQLLDCFSTDILLVPNKDVTTISPNRIVYADLIVDIAIDMFGRTGTFYTPPQITDLLVQVLDPKSGDTICDPACGSASLLIGCADWIWKKSGSRRYELYGQEKNSASWALAKMHMIMHGEHSQHIAWGDTLSAPQFIESGTTLQKFDVVISHPPLSMVNWPFDEANNDRFDRYRRGLPPKTKADYAFISHMISTLRPNVGRMGVVVSHGVLFRTGAEKEIRKQLIEENLLDAVIGLPQKLIAGVSIPIVLMIFRKNKSDDKIFFIDASASYKENKLQNELEDKDIKKILLTYEKRTSIPNFSSLCSLDEVRAHEYSLNIPLYIHGHVEQPEIDITQIKEQRLKTQKELTEIDQKIAVLLEKLAKRIA